MLRTNLKKIEISNVVVILVESLLPRFSKGKVLVVPISIAAENFEKELEIKRTFRFFFSRKTNYTYVGVSTKREQLPNDEHIDDLAYHDSCWRSDGVEDYLNKVSAEIYHECVKKDSEEKHWYVHTSFGAFGPKVVDGEINQDK